MPSNRKEDFLWVSIDRGAHYDQILQQARDKTVSLSFEDDIHPLGINHNSASLQSSKMSSKFSNNSAKVKTTSKKASSTNEITFIDPLSAMSAKLEEDAEIIEGDSDGTGESITDLHDLQKSHKRPLSDEMWKELEESVLNSSLEFEGKIKIPSTFHEILVKLESTESSSLSTVQARLDFLEALESNGGKRTSKLLGLSEATGSLDRSSFPNFVELLNNQLAKYWKDDQRVAVVKLVIQIVKILSEPDDETIRFYPTMFFLLADLITYFGYLVYDRLVTKCPDLKVNFTFSDVGPQARELCKNWLYKIASIRELVPRFYMETAMLKCYKFSCEPEVFSALVDRLSLMARGIANPIVAAYARMYLIYTAQQVMPSNHEVVRICAKPNYDELLTIFKCGYSAHLNGNETGKHITNFDLFSPALKWIIASQIKGLDAVDPKRDNIIKRCFNELDVLQDPDAFIIHLLECVSPQFVAAEMTHLSRVVVSSAKNKITGGGDTAQSKNGSLLLSSFGNALIMASEFKAITSSNKQNLLTVLNQTWKAIMLIKNIEHYLLCANVYVSFTTLHFGFKELDVVLGDILTHLSMESSNENNPIHDTKATENEEKQDLHQVSKHNESTQNLINVIRLGVFGKDKDIWNPIRALTHCNNLMPLFEHLKQKDRVNLAKATLESICSIQKFRDFKNPTDNDATPEGKYDEPLSVNALIYLCSILSDSVDALTIEDERRQISGSICYVIRNINYGDDFENQLKVYTECRGLFKSLDTVQVCLTQVVLNLAAKVVRKSEQKQSHQKPKIHGFLQACCAFTYITIPSIRCLRTQMKLYILTGQVAFFCRCHGQGNASIQAAIDVIKQAASLKQSKVDQKIISILHEDLPNMISYLLVVPGYASATNSDVFEGNLQLIQFVLDVVQPISESDTYIMEVCNFYVKMLQLLSVTTWRKYSYHIGGVDSNDVLLYASDSSNIFVDRVNKMLSSITAQLQNLVLISMNNSPQKQKLIAWKLLYCILTNCNLDKSSRSLTSLAYNVWLINREGVYQKEITRLLSSISVDSASGNLSKLLRKINEVK